VQLYNRHQPLTAWTFWKTGIFLGIAHAAIVYFVVFFSTRKNGANVSCAAAKDSQVHVHHMHGLLNPGAVTRNPRPASQPSTAMGGPLLLVCQHVRSLLAQV